VIIYREVGPDVRIVRVLYGMRDLQRILREP
jgi:plasmid stabilization system protein ParE